jgi:hypothetical protein
MSLFRRCVPGGHAQAPPHNFKQASPHGLQAPRGVVDDEPEEKMDAGASSLVHTVLLLVTALLIWSVASRPLQFFSAGENGARDCVFLGRASVSCSAGAHPRASEPRR